MKKLTAALLLLVSLGCIQAKELIDNSDFSQGFERWHGDVTSGSDTPADPFAAPGTTTGLAIPLRADRWVKIYQEFVGQGDKLSLSLQYKFSKDLSFSIKPEDYENVTHSIGYDGWRAFQIPLRTWCLMISDFGPDHGRYYKIASKFGTDEVQTLTATVPGKDEEKKTLTICFPPGQGTVTLLKVSVSDDH